jgi:type IV secretory pathway VirB9-like protein
MASWRGEIDKCVNKKEEIWKVAIYQSAKRQQELQNVKRGNLDILICSYQTLVADRKKQKEFDEEDEQKKQAAKKSKSKKANVNVNAKKKSSSGTRHEEDSESDSDSENDWEPDADSDDDDDTFVRRPSKNQRPSYFIFDLDFHRVVLDEAHAIRRPRPLPLQQVSMPFTSWR